LHTLGQLSEKQLRILHFASHVGVEFEASIVANAMGMPPMELLWELVQIESVLGVIHDVADVDDLFRFSSGGFVAALRGYACELLSHVSHDQPPQLTRQCHLQIADALVKHEADVVNAQTLQEGVSGDVHALGVPERGPAAWFRLARHAVAAGSKRGALAFVACCAAARAARSQSALDATIRYAIWRSSASRRRSCRRRWPPIRRCAPAWWRARRHARVARRVAAVRHREELGAGAARHFEPLAAVAAGGAGGARARARVRVQSRRCDAARHRARRARKATCRR
jgi:hypothetical protein